MKRVYLGILFLLLAVRPVEAVKKRQATIVNPVRGRNLWISKDLELLRGQYEAIKNKGLKASWLLQYDVLLDKELLGEIKSFNDKQEIGLFLEISPELARMARVNYKPERPWYKPDVVFLSGYGRSERRKLINEMFDQFKNEFGFYPSAAGAWWIDSWSLGYMQKKYGVKIALIVADQKTTDNYGVWGQWWGAPYKASKYNVLVPDDGLTIIQWALRDPELAVGEGPEFSNYSLQANDYLERDLGTDHFVDLAEKYLETSGQITVGLEVGMEGAKNLGEYNRQINWLADKTETVKMSEFASGFEAFDEIQLGDWQMTKKARINEKIGEEIKYESKIVFADYFVADNDDFLDRVLPIGKEKKFYVPYWILLWLLGLGIAIKSKKYEWFGWGSLFLVLGFGQILKSRWQLGWWVFYGPVVKNLALVQTIITAGILGMFYFLKDKKWLWMLALAFWINPIIRIARLSMIEGEYLAGIMINGFRFVGIGIKNGIRSLNQDFESGVASAFLKFDLGNYWLETGIKFILGLVGIWLIDKLPKNWKRIILGLMVILTLIDLWQKLTGDPIAVL